jgi:hypothetical protein
MPRDGAIIFSDLIGKLRVACEKCGRDGCYGLNRLIERRGRDAKLIAIGSMRSPPTVRSSKRTVRTIRAALNARNCRTCCSDTGRVQRHVNKRWRISKLGG